MVLKKSSSWRRGMLILEVCNNKQPSQFHVAQIYEQHRNVAGDIELMAISI